MIKTKYLTNLIIDVVNIGCFKWYRFTELKHMEEDEAYLKDFGHMTP